MVEKYHSLAAIRKDLEAGKATIPDLVNEYLRNAFERAHLNAFLELFEEEARSKAAEIQEKFQQGKAGRLAGLVIAIKDNICFRSHKVSAASKILENFESLFTATAVERLIAEDAIIIGRTNCDEFAMGGSNENSAFGAVLNPLDETRVPGGSSGGSAAAVAAHMCHAALGSDTGGSIRQPASFTGTVGLKPTYGRVSRWGLIAYASSFDQIGPIAHSIDDVELIYSVIAGADSHDSTCSTCPVDPALPGNKETGKKRVAVLKECLHSEGINPEVRSAALQIINTFKEMGHEVEEVSFPFLQHLVPAYYILTTAEASSNLARFDGIHYGHRSTSAAGIERTYTLSRSEGFGAEVKRRIMLGTFVLSSGYYDAYYSRAQKVRRLLRDHIEKIFESHDYIFMPTAVDEAFKIGEKSSDPIAMYLQDIFTVLANLTGHPAISLPLAQKADGMPVGYQLMAPRFAEAQLFSFSRTIA